jgi:hypothetical protein
MKLLPLVALAALASLGPLASAQTIFRCGHAYSSVACADAQVVVVVASAVTSEQRSQAREVVQREKALAAEMARDRRSQEAALKPALATSLSAPPRAPVVSAPVKKAAKRKKSALPIDEGRDFVASVPKVKKPRS